MEFFRKLRRAWTLAARNDDAILSADSLANLASAADIEGISTSDMLARVLSHYPDGRFPVRTATLAVPVTDVSHHCRFLWESVTVLSDGRVTCGLDDPYGEHAYGNLAVESAVGAFLNPAADARRRSLLRGEVCRDCHLYEPLSTPGQIIPLRRPTQLIVEPAVVCNIRCAQTCCEVVNADHRAVRARPFLDPLVFRRVIDELKDSLKLIYFFHYGEPFLHPQAAEMIAYAKSSSPGAAIHSSTNGIPLARKPLAEAVVAAGIDHLTFTIGGARQQSYEIYHANGRLDLALEGLQNVLEARRSMGAKRPLCVWRYLLFNWNDSDEEIAEARAIAGRLGVDQLVFCLTHVPEHGRSTLRMPGTPGFELIRDQCQTARDYDFAPAPSESGLFPPESDDTLGVFSWMGRHAKFRLPGGTSLVRLDAAVHGPSEALEGLRVNVRLPWLPSGHAGYGHGEWVHNLYPVPELLRQAAFELNLEASRTWRPSDFGYNQDNRDLGAIVRVHGAL